MSSTLPARPHPDHLRRQARELHRALLAQEPSALARAAPYRLGTATKLSAAQLIIARELGFASWPKLLEEVERRRAAELSDAEYVRKVLTLALGEGWQAPQPSRALALARTRQVDSLAMSLVLGDLPAVQRGLTGADLAALLPPLGWPALAYAAASSLARLDDTRPGLVVTVEWLLAQGADPNTRWADPVHHEERLPVLYGAVARASCLATTQALLQAGADPNDNESLYHATEQADRRIVAALVQAGARWQGTNALLRQLDHDKLDDLRQLLDLGADINESDPQGATPLHHAITRGRPLAFVRLLVERGADPSAKDGLGRTPAALAALGGDAQTVAYLASLGHAAPQDAQAGFLAACAAGDAAAARGHLAVQPDAIAALDARALRLLPDQAQRGRLESVRLMLELGWPVAVQGDWEASALNQAAFRGDANMVRLLLEHGARWHEPNGFGGNAVGSCLHASCNMPHPNGDYPAVLSMLLADGAPPLSDTADLPDDMQAVVASPVGQ